MKNAPKEIYLVTGIDKPNEEPDYKDLSGISWNEFPIYNGDIKYINASVIESALSLNPAKFETPKALLDFINEQVK